ncbi:unnamed protein product [Chrysoparadoxa australica]
MLNWFSQEKNLWNKYNPIISSINNLETTIKELSDLELRTKTYQLQKEIAKTNVINEKILTESFALVREASKRTLDLRHYNTQLLGGLVLNDGKIAEMRTGEGKTLVATAPAFTNALTGRGVHIVTVNEYLAERDVGWMGQIYRFLGLNVGLVNSQMTTEQRKKNYNRDITYVTNGELGFDFLRDNLTTDINEVVQKPFNFCIVDEVDSVLIDEARTPLIISSTTKIDIEKIIKANEVAKFLEETKDFEVDEKSKNVSLTSKGNTKAQRLLNISNIYNSNEPWIPFILNALKAKKLFLKDIHYIVKNNQIVIVDEFTGRIMEGRKWSEGLHQAVEVKEGIYINEGSETIASITYQNFFRLYPKLSGMTGTAKTEELEFENIYNLQVSVIPTFKPTQRKDLPDLIYIDEVSKWKAIAKECYNIYQTQRPILVGTTTIQNSEILSQLLKSYNVPHQLLNAKPENIKRESGIIAQAGCLKAITIATNMAGRGTDILLGGNPEFQARQLTIEILNKVINDEKIKSQLHLEPIIFEIRKNVNLLKYLQKKFDILLNVINIPNKDLTSFEKNIFLLYKNILKDVKETSNKQAEIVRNLGGLYVIGTERHESRRIDNQLRGRAGRQGDPGMSRFFLSLNDPLLKVFGGDKIKNVMQTFQMNEEALESKFLSDSLDSAQQKVEGFYYDQRKTLNKYDKVIDKQRRIVYKFRQKVLSTSTIRDLILEFGEAMINDIIQSIEISNNFIVIPERIQQLLYTLNLSLQIKEINFPLNSTNLKSYLYQQFWSIYNLKELQFSFYDLKLFRKYEKVLVLKYLDLSWSKHLENLNYLKDSVSWEAYAQKDPFLRYEERAEELLNLSLISCRDSIIYDLLGSEII